MICIDDFGIKKRQKYGTIMVDGKTGRIIDLIESRESEDVKNWLMRFLNIKIVSRDGSQAYAKAIAEAHPQAIQVSDRFHIIKNLCGRGTECLQKMFRGRVSIPLTEGTKQHRKTMADGTAAQRVETIKALHAQGKSKEEIRAITGSAIKTINRYIKATDIESVRGKQHTEAVKKVQMKADLVKRLSADGYSIKAISVETGFTYERIKEYLSESFEPINAHYGNRREGKLAPYREKVIQMYRDGHPYKLIFRYIKERGYDGTENAIRGFISKEKRIQADFQNCDAEELLERKWLVQLLYRPLSQVKGITGEQLNAVKTKYPLVELIYSTVAEFRDVFKSANPSLLIDWM